MLGHHLKLRLIVRQAVRDVQPDATVLYVPPPTAADAIIEAIEAEVRGCVPVLGDMTGPSAPRVRL